MNHPVVEALGQTLIHSLWECAIVALLFAVFNLLVRTANARYVTGCIAMLLMLAVPAITFCSLFERTDSVSPPAVVSAPVRAAVAVIHQTAVVPVAESSSLLAITVWLWLTGVIAMTVWSGAGWVVAQRLKYHGKLAVSEDWQQRLMIVATRLHVHRTIRFYQSITAQAPTVIGWIRPVILMPMGALIHLTAEELEAVLAHELAHIRRHDYLVNLLQTAIETLLFYHPGVWWVGKRIRAEREHCCDDRAVGVCGDRLVYARALTSLEELRCAGPRFAMAATGGELSGRIRRIFNSRQPVTRTLPFWLLAALPLLLSTLLFVNTRVHAESPKSKAPVHAPAPLFASTPAPPPVIVARSHGEGYLAGLADAGYTNISVDEIIELKQNGVDPEYIKEMLRAGFGVLSPRELISLKNNGVPHEYARAVKSSGIRDANVEGVIRLHQHGVRPDLLEALAAAGYKDVSVAQAVQAQDSGLSGSALRSLLEQGFKNLTFEQVIKLKRAGVI